MATSIGIDVRTKDRLSAAELNKITAEHVWKALLLLESGYVEHGFGASTDFDLIADDGTKLPPKAVFGIAATEALGFRVLPKHFSSGEGSPCFRILRSAGYNILQKSVDPTVQTMPQQSLDEQWAEGNVKLVAHVRRERGKGLSRAKKAEFRRFHNGKLFCERCALDPIDKYGTEHAEACIEVHHHAFQVRDMEEAHHSAKGLAMSLRQLPPTCASAS